MKPIIYQLVVRYFGNVNTTNQIDGSIKTNGCGKFADINDEALRSLRQLGVTHIWLTGCLRQATLTDYSAIGLPPDDPDVVKGLAGSFYAVRDYFDVCPDYARDPLRRMEEFRELIERVHAAGMKALIDFVPNHVARGYDSIVKPELNFGVGDDTRVFFHHNNHFFYLVDPPGQKLKLTKPKSWKPRGVQFDGEFWREDGAPGRPPKATGNNAATASPSEFDWYETVKLNYGYNFTTGWGRYWPRPRTWETMDQVLAYWQAQGVDGFRCDFAHYVPPEAWAFLISEARRREPHTYFIAEAYPSESSGDPITRREQLTDAGFHAVYHHESYNALKRIYQGHGTQEDYHHAIVALTPQARREAATYLENHDERRIASPVTFDRGAGESGFGSAEAAYQLAPLHFLSGPGPVLVFNGQEVGEPAVGASGYSGDDGRTTLFDYWCMPEFAKWVNNHAYDGERLSAAQKQLRAWYAALLALCQDPAVLEDGYWGLKSFNCADEFDDCSEFLYSFARFSHGSGRLLVVATSFSPEGMLSTRLRIPEALAEHAGLREVVTVRLCLDRGGAKDEVVAKVSRAKLVADGFVVRLPNQTSHVYSIT